MLTLVIINCSVVCLVVAIHFEMLSLLTRFLPHLPLRPRHKIMVGVLYCLTAHAVEVWIFAFAYYFMNKAGYWGAFTGAFDHSLLDCVYFSFTSFSTLGFGDIVPTGGIRFLTGIESLTGLLLITWSASFLYLEMTTYWNKD
ncbi:potassium channel family protein [Neptunicella marina]|uniref:Two pore domain potassium channel family protein n=1 Tax=Neptunicella marina TaxID=2125989 RepID=A0A8J6J1X4_9ALTE|nr:potassium channel family protein [Neptunicella marina]MBC3767923.1 two pore domain potassium channel family protein [Neptunicella marina]